MAQRKLAERRTHEPHACDWRSAANVSAALAQWAGAGVRCAAAACAVHAQVLPQWTRCHVEVDGRRCESALAVRGEAVRVQCVCEAGVADASAGARDSSDARNRAVNVQDSSAKRKRAVHLLDSSDARNRAVNVQDSSAKRKRAVHLLDSSDARKRAVNVLTDSSAKRKRAVHLLDSSDARKRASVRLKVHRPWPSEPPATRRSELTVVHSELLTRVLARDAVLERAARRRDEAREPQLDVLVLAFDAVSTRRFLRHAPATSALLSAWHSESDGSHELVQFLHYNVDSADASDNFRALFTGKRALQRTARRAGYATAMALVSGQGKAGALWCIDG